MEQRLIFTDNLAETLAIALSECEHDRLFVVADEHTAALCWPLVGGMLCLRGAHLLTIPAGDGAKTLTTATALWEQLSQLGATRHSCIVNLGGGMVTDLGGFVASTYMRGMNYINLPTSLLCMVDASAGGKTGVNLGGLKNLVGVFSEPSFVIIHTPFLCTLDGPNLLAGQAEMLKHALLSGEAMWAETLRWMLAPTVSGGSAAKSVCSGSAAGIVDADLLRRNIAVKQRIVADDPHERGIRKALNLGHTVGHALETFFNSRGEGLLHGHAVAHGLVVELFLSAVKCGFPTDKLRQTVAAIRELYGRLDIRCDDYDALLSLMRHDKKNHSSIINFTFLADTGLIRIDQTATDEEIREALDFYREGI